MPENASLTLMVVIEWYLVMGFGLNKDCRLPFIWALRIRCVDIPFILAHWHLCASATLFDETQLVEFIC